MGREAGRQFDAQSPMLRNIDLAAMILGVRWTTKEY
jgi:hypothetical protein